MTNPNPSPELREAFQAFFDAVTGDECHHDNTRRGGAIWTICDDCGGKWADDQGGFTGYADPEHIAAARAALSPQTLSAPGEPSRYHFTNDAPVTVSSAAGEVQIGAGWLA